MRRLILALLVLGGLASTGLVLLYFVLSPGYLASYITDTVGEATGRQVTIASGPRLSLWPRPAIRLKGIAIANPPGAVQGVLATAEAMEIRMSPGAFWHRRPDIRELHLTRPELNLVIAKDGQANWEFADTRSDRNGDGIALPPIYVDDGTIHFTDERTGTSTTLPHLDFVLTLGPEVQPIEVKGSGEWRGDRASFSLYIKSPRELASAGTPLDFNLSSSRLSLAYSGRAVLRDGLELSGQVDARSRSLRELARWSGVKIAEGRGLNAVTISGSLGVKGSRYNFKKARLTLDGQNAQGDVSIDLAEARPLITARLGVDQIDVNQYAPPREGSAFTSAGTGLDGWSAADLDFAALKGVDALLTINAARLVYGDLATGRGTIEASLQNGILNAELKGVSLYGGNLEGTVTLDGGRDLPRLSLDARARGLDARGFLSDLARFGFLAGGLDLDLSVSTQGRNQQEMIGALNGTAGIRLADGSVLGADAGEIARAAGRSILTGWGQGRDAETAFDSLKADFTIADGLADTRNLSMSGALVRVAGSGTVDLLKREVDFRIDPQLPTLAGSGVGYEAALAVPLVVAGPWNKPRFYPDIAGILENPAAGFHRLDGMMEELRRQATGKTGQADKAKSTIEEKVEPATQTREEPKSALDMLKQQLFDGDGVQGFSGEQELESVPVQ